MLFDKMNKDAHISKCGKHRYSLTRVWGDKYKLLTWLMLNPSTADHTVDDPTIRRCVGFAKDWGYGGIEVVNLFSYRATEPKKLLKCKEPNDRESDATLWVVLSCWPVVCAWGSWGDKFPARVGEVKDFIYTCVGIPDHILCLGTTKSGQPKHPLYVASKTKPVPFSVE